MEQEALREVGRREVRGILHDCLQGTGATGGALFLRGSRGTPSEPLRVGLGSRRELLEALGCATVTEAWTRLLRWAARPGEAPRHVLAVAVRGPRGAGGLLCLLAPGGRRLAGCCGPVALAGARAVSRHLALERTAARLERHWFSTIMALLNTIEAKDHYTRGHSTRVAAYCARAGEAAGLPRARLDALNRAALLHDIGKVGIVDTILMKATPLTAEEMAMVRLHPIIGEQIVRDLSFMREASRLIRAHHERHDGRGYPDGIAGRRIPVAARILALAEAFDTITSETPYRAGRSIEEAALELRRERGRQFDPALTDLFLESVILG